MNATTIPSRTQVSALCWFQRPWVRVVCAEDPDAASGVATAAEHRAVLGAHVEHGRRPFARIVVATGSDRGKIER
jgi:hypothetical protein